MASLETTRHKLPMLSVSQAQKEITHNEALVRIDALLHPAVEDELGVPPNLNDSDVGRCWLVSNPAIGDWADHSGELAIWVGGGWRFFNGTEGMRVRLVRWGSDWTWSNGAWNAAPIISNPSGGPLIDSEARLAISELLGHLRSIGILTI